MRYPTPLFPIIVAKMIGGGGGGSVTAAAVLSAMEAMTASQASDALDAINGEPQKLIVTVTESGGVYSADKTFAEMVDALSEGKTIIVSDGEAVYNLAYYDGDALMTFSRPIGNSIQAFLVETDGDTDTWDLTRNILATATSIVTDQSSTSITIDSAADNTIYQYGELSALTITSITATGDFIIRFTSGATATTTNFPATMKYAEAFAAEANTRYEINVSNGYALVASWPVS